MQRRGLRWLHNSDTNSARVLSAISSSFRPDVIAICACLAVWARAGVLTGASIDQAHAVEQMRCV